MKFIILAALLLLCYVTATLSVPTQLSFNKGQQIVYKLHALVDARGNVQSQGSTDGTFSTMDSIMVIKCVDKDASSFVFAMNMFNTEVNVGQDSNRPSSIPVFSNDSNSNALGYDMYFQQALTGEMMKIWYNKADDMYFVNVKLGAINSLQTKVTAPGQTQTVLESDPVGVHYSEMTGKQSANDELLVVEKTFSQKDFEKFSDPDVTKNNVALMARASTGIHTSGFIQSAQSEQYGTLVNMARSSNAEAKRQRASGVNTNSTGFDMDMQSHGVLNINYQSQSMVSQSQYFPLVFKNRVELENSAGHVRFDSLYHVAVKSVVHSKNQIPEINDVQSMLDIVFTTGDVKSHMNNINKLIRYFNNKNVKEEAHKLLEQYFVQIEKSKYLRAKLLVLATSLNNQQVHNQIVKHCLLNGNAETIYHTLLAITAGVKQSSNSLIAGVSGVVSSKDVQIRDAAMLAYGSLLSVTQDEQQVANGRQFLIETLKQSIATNDVTIIVSCLGAISNAGANIIPLNLIPVSVFSHGRIQVKVAATMVLQKYAHSSFPAEAKKMVSILKAQDDPDFPYAKDYKLDWSVGGSTVSAKFDAELFAGTNFDCNHPDFNYKAFAEATGSLSLFGAEEQVFDARAIYGKKGSQLVGNELFLSVFGKVLYQRDILGTLVDCNEHVYDLYHASPGFSVSYTVWISVIPVTFRASASVVLDAKWGWNVCDAQLSALVELIPEADIVVAGDAEIDLLIIRAAIELNGRFSASLVPQAYVHGTLCTVGFDVKLITQPMTATLEAYYMTKHCKYLFFDCKWGEHHNKVIWQWQLPSKSDILYEKEYKISV
jgi:hypothetical protein